MEWISVKDRLPDIGEAVLVLDRYGPGVKTNGYIRQVRRHASWKEYWVFTDVPPRYTHWMPLPAPPHE